MSHSSIFAYRQLSFSRCVAMPNFVLFRLVSYNFKGSQSPIFSIRACCAHEHFTKKYGNCTYIHE